MPEAATTKTSTGRPLPGTTPPRLATTRAVRSRLCWVGRDRLPQAVRNENGTRMRRLWLRRRRRWLRRAAARRRRWRRRCLKLPRPCQARRLDLHMWHAQVSRILGAHLPVGQVAYLPAPLPAALPGASTASAAGPRGPPPLCEADQDRRLRIKCAKVHGGSSIPSKAPVPRLLHHNFGEVK